MATGIVQFVDKLKSTKFADIFNKWALSPYLIAFWTGFALICHVFSLEFIFYVLVCIYSILVIFFANDFASMMPLFVLCYLVPSKKNNPGITETSVFYGATGNAILIMAMLVAVLALLRIIFDKNMGIKKLFLQKRSLISGMLALGLAYMLCGIGRPGYWDIFGNNIACGLIQFASIFVLYFIFTATTEWKKIPKGYFAWIGIAMGLLVSAEVLNVYIINNVVRDGSIERWFIVTGWGHYNNIGAILSMAIPFAFYMCCKSKHNYIFLSIAVLFMIFLLLSCSRGSIVCGILIFGISFLITFFRADNKKVFRIATLVYVLIGIILLIVLKDWILTLFKNVPNIINQETNNFNDSERFEVYKKGLQAFVNLPIFGQSFFPYGYAPYEFSVVNSLNRFFPPRWHNTIVQILSACGIVGMVAYVLHRYQTIKLFVKAPSIEKTFIGLSILVLLLMSLLDCHFFNMGPTLIYSMALAFAEKIHSED